jgi:hypothetical protein
MSGGPMTPAHIAVAIVAACGVTKTKPEAVFAEGNQRPRVMAAAGCIARLGWDRKATAKAFRVHPNRLTPSGLGLAKVDTDHLLIIAEALETHGLTEAVKAAVPVSPEPAAKAATPKRKPEAKAPRPVPEPTVPPPEPPPPRSAEVRAMPVRSFRTNPVRRKTPAPSSKVERLKPITDRIVRWASQQLALGADLDFVAWCFDVPADSLADALRPQRAVAA